MYKCVNCIYLVIWVLNLDQQDINDIFRQFPWATEATLSQIADLSNDRMGMLQKEVDIIRGQFGLEEIAWNIKNYNKGIKEGIKDVIDNTAEHGEKLIRNLERDSDPIQATAELMSMAGDVGGKALKGAGGLLKGIPKVGEFLSKGSGFAGKALEFVGGAATALTFIAKEQEKISRLYIDYGMMVADQTKMTDLRGSLADVGMSMAELQPILDSTKNVFAHVGKDSMTGAKAFVNMAAMYERGAMDTSDFGYTSIELTSRLAEEANILYGVGKLDKLNAQQQKRVTDNFESSSARVTYLAEVTGEQRSAMLKMRQEAAQNIDFRQAYMQNAKFVEDNLGAQAGQNIVDAQQLVHMMFSQFMPQLAPEVDQLFSDGVRDLHLNQTVMDNVKGPLAEKLAMLGPQSQGQFYDLMDKAISGKMVGDDLILAFKDLGNSIAEAETLQGGAGNTFSQSLNTLIMQMQSMPDAFRNMSKTSLEEGQKRAAQKSEDADAPIDAMDSVRKGFRNAVHTLTPGFETTAAAVDGFTDAVNFVGDIFDSIGIGYKNPKRELEKKDKARREKVKDYNDDINGIQSQIKDTEARIANPAWWESPERLKQYKKILERELARKQEERDILSKGRITQKGQTWKTILSEGKKKAAATKKATASSPLKTTPKTTTTSPPKASTPKDDTSLQTPKEPTKTLTPEDTAREMLGDDTSLQNAMKVRDEIYAKIEKGQAEGPQFGEAGFDEHNDAMNKLATIASKLIDIGVETNKEKRYLDYNKGQQQGKGPDFSDERFLAEQNGGVAGDEETGYLLWLREQLQEGVEGIEFTEDQKQRLWEIENKGSASLVDNKEQLNTLMQEHNRLKAEAKSLRSSKEGLFSGMFWDEKDEKQLKGTEHFAEDILRRINYNLEHMNLKDLADGR